MRIRCDAQKHYRRSIVGNINKAESGGDYIYIYDIE